MSILKVNAIQLVSGEMLQLPKVLELNADKITVGTATGAATGQIKTSAEIIAPPDKGFQLANFMRELCGSKNIGDNVATTIFYVNVKGTYVNNAEALLIVDLLLDVAEVGYAAVGERWLVALRAYCFGDNTKSFGAGTPVRVATSDAGSANPSYADVDSGTLTVVPAPGDNRFEIKMQADATGSFGGSVMCHYRAQLSPMQTTWADMTLMTLTAAT